MIPYIQLKQAPMRIMRLGRTLVHGAKQNIWIAVHTYQHDWLYP